MLLLSYFFSFLSGILERRNFVPLKYSRKVFNTIGTYYRCAFLITPNWSRPVAQRDERLTGLVVQQQLQPVAIRVVNIWILWNSAGHWVPMCALIALGYVTADEKDLAIFLLVVAVGINSSTYLGFQVRNFQTNATWHRSHFKWFSLEFFILMPLQLIFNVCVRFCSFHRLTTSTLHRTLLAL